MIDKAISPQTTPIPRRMAVQPHRIAGGISLLALLIGLLAIRQQNNALEPEVPLTPSPTTGNITTSVTHPSTSQNAGQQRTNNVPSRGELPFLTSSSNDPNAEKIPRSFEVATSPALPQYTVQDFSGALRDKEEFRAASLSETGAVLGMTTPYAPFPQNIGLQRMSADGIRPIPREAPRTQAAIWQKGKLLRLPLPAKYHRVIPSDMNSKGDVAAIAMYYRRGRPPFTSILLYTDAGRKMKDIGTLDPTFANLDTTDPEKMRGVTEGTVHINNRGTLVALVGLHTLVRYPEDGSLIDLGSGLSYDLNEKDIAVGYSNDSLVNAVCWKLATKEKHIPYESLLPADPSRKSTEPPNPNTTMQGISECINENQQIVIAVVASNSGTNLRRQGRTVYYLWDKGKLHYIALMRGAQFGHTRINNSGDIVGFNDFDADTQQMMPCMYHKGKIYDLTNVVKKAGWTVAGAVDINSAGQILAVGYKTTKAAKLRQMVSILLTPVQ